MTARSSRYRRCSTRDLLHRLRPSLCSCNRAVWWKKQRKERTAEAAARKAGCIVQVPLLRTKPSRLSQSTRGDSALYDGSRVCIAPARRREGLVTVVCGLFDPVRRSYCDQQVGVPVPSMLPDRRAANFRLSQRRDRRLISSGFRSGVSYLCPPMKLE